MPVKTSFRESKARTGRVGVGRARSSGYGGENMNSNGRRRVSIKKERSSENGDENISLKDQRERMGVKGQSSRTERRESSSRNESAEFEEEIKDSKARKGGVIKGKARSSERSGENMKSSNRKTVGIRRSSGNGDENVNLKEQRERKSIKGKSSRTERRGPVSRNEMTASDYEGVIKDNTPRKEKVIIRKSRSSGNVGNDRRSISIRKTRSSGNGDENINLKDQLEGRSVKRRSSPTERRDMSSRDEQADFDCREQTKVKGMKQGLKSKRQDENKDMGNEEFQQENVSLKRKRVYSNKNSGNTETSNGKSMPKVAKNEVRVLKEKRMGKEKLEKSANKKFEGEKAMGNDNAEEPDQPKKKKRMRIDPYDFSNKRMDDGLITKDGEEKKKDLPKSSNGVEMSMNAQFRAIRPSQSILSYVEDNLLGRRREIEIKRAGYNIELPSPLDNIPFSTCSERERIEEPAFRNKLEFFAAAKLSSSFPPLELPEIAFAGRSNVGKSSMLNALTRQWGVVRTSDKPGLTQSINFFKLGSKLCLVDLPGYGFAYAKEEAKEAWEELVKEYVSTRVGLKRVCLLVDTKWGMKQRDYELVDLMERSKTKYQIVLTKTDLVFPIDVARRAMQIEESLKGKKSAVQPAMMVSSKSGAGIRICKGDKCDLTFLGTDSTIPHQTRFRFLTDLFNSPFGSMAQSTLTSELSMGFRFLLLLDLIVIS
ncbi:hypothetical protein LIER_00302 [Lithospermum erythrorhizon]|uniref:EngB-type G domain-containing protein n=1 Tax=Lithospermum erythrorhizon TaxID=34254 RepID=A0AAV3NGY1_LITER